MIASIAAARRVDVAVIGAGVVGLAIAERLSRTRSVAVIEQHEGPARETSSRNSGVIHAGIYYPTGSLKHRLCWEGNAALYEWADAHRVPVLRCGKLIAALAEDERDGLDAVYRQAVRNEVRDVAWLTGAEARELEPHVPIVEAIWSPSTGVVATPALVRSFEDAAREHGATFAYGHTVTAIERTGDGFTLYLDAPEGTDSADGATAIACEALVNSAGLRADAVAALLGYPLDGGTIDGIPVPVMRQRLNRGLYYDIVDPAMRSLVSRPVYPLPEHAAGGLGLHLTMDPDGGAHIGPSTEWLEDGAPADYAHPDDPAWRERFLRAGQRFLPGLRAEHLGPGQVGYRPKLQQPGDEQADFLLWHDRGYVHLGGIESPGLTASIPLAREVERALG